MRIELPEFSLVVLVGVSGSGKSSFARKHFKSTEILSSDYCRGLVSDDENNQAATNDAFDVLYAIARKRLKNGLLTVIDATNVQKESRKGLVALAREFHCLPVAVVLDIPQTVCLERNAARPDRDFGAHVIIKQTQQLRQSLRSLKDEGFRQIVVLDSVEDVEAVEEIARQKLYNNKKDDHGPFDIIGDVHGCFDELQQLLVNLGYVVDSVPEDGTNFGYRVVAPESRKVVFVGDLVDRGPNSPAVLRLVMSMVGAGTAYCVPGNHDAKLRDYLSGKKVTIKHGLQETVDQLESESNDFKAQTRDFLHGLVSHYVFDEGRLVVAHAGLKEEMQGRGSGAVRAFAMYGETTGEVDEFGLPIRYNWAKEYRGSAKVVFGHTPVPRAEWLNRTIDIDTGCVFGGSLTALRYPEEQLVSVPARQVYCEPVRPIGGAATEPGQTAQQVSDDLLDIDDVIGKRIVQTRLRNNITILEENSIAALEVMSRFAVNPKWLMYLPPTMSPSATSKLPEYLEHPDQAFSYYRKHGIETVVCEEKHMGSRAVLVVCRDEATAQTRFGVSGEGLGVCYTRTGRNFFTDNSVEKEFLARVSDCLSRTQFWEKHDTDWVCLDAELMPWSAKAQSLLEGQYAAVGTAASASLSAVEAALKAASARGVSPADSVLDRTSQRSSAVSRYIHAYRQYCWPVTSVGDYKLAPFHLLATEGKTYTDKDHVWHMTALAEICQGDPELFRVTPYKVVQLSDAESVTDATNWWVELTGKGGEGMVVKPLQFVSLEKGQILQPAVKCRGKEYLRIIYGPEYDLPENLERLRSRGLGRKQSLALREFALGVEALERFVNKEPLRRVHESVFGVLALESEEVDPRL